MSFKFKSLNEGEKNKKHKPKAWDSYFSHHCALGLDVDVLISDIERDYFVCIRRWWHNLFLVSYDNNYFSSCCMSTCAIRNERARQFRSYGFRVHPFSPFKNFWDRIILGVTILNIYFITLLSSCIYVMKDNNMHNVCITITIFMEVIIIGDIFLNFKMGYIEKHSCYVEFEQAWISMNYLSNTILLHFVSAIPWLTILKVTKQLEVDSGSAKIQLCTAYESIVCVASLGRLSRLFEIIFYRRSRCILFRRNTSLAKHCTYILLIGTLFVHVLTCLHLAVTVIFVSFDSPTPKLRAHTWFSAHRLGIYVDKHYDPFDLYMKDIQKTAQIFFSTHNSIGHPSANISENIIFIATLVIGWIFPVWMMIDLMTLIRQQNYGQNLILKQVQCAVNMVRARALPDRLDKRVRAYYAMRAVREEAALWEHTMYSVLPRKMRNELMVATHRAVLRRVLLFRYWSTEIIDEMALRLKGAELLPGDPIVTDALGGGRLYIVESGKVKLWESNSQWSEARAGAHFACRSGCALTVCSLLYLELAEARRLLHSRPDLLDQLADYIAQ